MKILFADDDSAIRKAVEYDFKEREIDAFFAMDGKEAQDIFDKFEPGIVILDIKMPKIDGMRLLEYIIKKAPETQVMMISAHGTIELAVEAMKIGAQDFIVKPFSLEELSLKINKLKEKYLKEENIDNNFDFIGSSLKFKDMLSMLKKLARVNTTVLITGESGTGKEMAARFLHDNSNRKNKEFIAVNCAMLSKELLASELFGHKKGSFTGAIDDRIGKFKAADKGTIFLDEVGEIDKELQAKLLRVLEQSEIEIIGESKPEKIDVRVIAATNRDLKEYVEQGNFREDLYYRLNVINVTIPSLIERKDDIKELSEYFIDNISNKTGIDIDGISYNAVKSLKEYNWPGNVRELKNSIERAIVLTDNKVLQEEDFNFLISDNSKKMEEKKELRADFEMDNEEKKIKENLTPYLSLEQKEKNMIIDHMKQSKNKTELAKKLGLKRTTLLYKLKKYEIEF